jgi:DNA mismatch repair ATPase MutL
MYPTIFYPTILYPTIFYLYIFYPIFYPTYFYPTNHPNLPTLSFGADDVNELASMILDSGGGGGMGGGDAMDAVSQRVDKSYLMLKNDDMTMGVGGDGEILGFNGTGSDGGSFRLPKLVALYASRACRSAVMIGTALRPAEMARIVGRMKDVHQPWNCPHGRPTLRHLADVEAVRVRKLAQLR